MRHLMSRGSSSILGGQEAQMPLSKVVFVPGSLTASHPAVPSPALVHPQAASLLPGRGNGLYAHFKTYL